MLSRAKALVAVLFCGNLNFKKKKSRGGGTHGWTSFGILRVNDKGDRICMSYRRWITTMIGLGRLVGRAAAPNF